LPYFYPDIFSENTFSIDKNNKDPEGFFMMDLSLLGNSRFYG